MSDTLLDIGNIFNLNEKKHNENKHWRLDFYSNQNKKFTFKNYFKMTQKMINWV